MGGDHNRRGSSTGSFARHWMPPLGLILLCAGLWLAGDPAYRLFAFERSRIVADAEAWRLASAHFLHLGFAHLAMNAAAVLLVWALVGRAFGPRRWCGSIALIAVGTGLGILLFVPAVTGYVGLSGVLHGVLAAGAIARLPEHRIESAVLLGALALKLAFEFVAGPSPFSESLIGGRVIYQAHAIGALCGAATGFFAILRPERR